MEEERSHTHVDFINNLVTWYQHKIGQYDKQLWEKSVEQKVLKGITQVPRKSARVKAELIDVDLVRGSTFTKAKPQYSWLAVSVNGLLRVFFMPLFIQWWSRVTSRWFSLGILVLYCLQIAATIAYTLESEELASRDKLADLLSSVHIIVPWCMMIVLGVLQSHIVATRVSHKTSSNQPKKEKREPSNKSCRRKTTTRQKGAQQDSGSQETGAETGAETGYDGTGAPNTRSRKLSNSRRPKPARENSVRKSTRILLNLPGLQTMMVNDYSQPDGCRTDQDHSRVKPSVRISEPCDLQREYSQFQEDDSLFDEDSNKSPVNKSKHPKAEKDCQPEETGFQVIDNSNGLEGHSDISDDGMLCGNSQEDPTSLDQPLPNGVGCILLPDEDITFRIRDSDTELAQQNGRPCEEIEHLTVNNSTEHDDKEYPSEGSSLSTAESGAGCEEAPLQNGLTITSPLLNKDHSSCESDVDTAPNTPVLNKKPVFLKSRSSRHFSSQRHGSVNMMDTDCAQTSEMEWEETGMNSEVTTSDTSNCSTPDSDSDTKGDHRDLSFNHHLHNVSSVLGNLASNTDKVSCMIWEGEEVKKVDLTVLELGWTIIQNVEQIPRSCDYLYFGLFIAVLDTIMPLCFRIYHTREELSSTLHGPSLFSLGNIYLTLTMLFGSQGRILLIVVNSMVQRWFLSLIFFFLLSVAERTFKQRLLYAKNFCYLTSSRRARKYQLPHFRLNKVRNIKTWLSLRSFLKKRGPQRSVDMIVSAAFLTAVMLVSLMSVQLLNDSAGFLDHIGNWELILWCFVLATYLLRFMTLGTKINKKYRNFSVLITEQINLYLHMELKPHKKEELMRANSVLKLAEDLLKELESPFKISGLSANPFLYNITKVVVLSAFSAVLTELLGFKLKLYKIKLRA